MVHSPYDHGESMEPRFWAPEIAPEYENPAPLVPPNARIRKRRGYVPDPVEEAVPRPSQDPRVTYLRQRSVELGEVQFPLDEVVIDSSMVPDHALPEWLGADALHKYSLRVRAREGSRLKRQLRFWTIIVALCILSALVAFIVNGLSGVEVTLPEVFLGAALVASGALVIRITSYGWLPWLRLLKISVSWDTDAREWRKGYGSAQRLELQRRIGKR